MAVLGLYMVWCSLFAGLASKLGLTGWMGRLALAQAVGGVMIWVMGSLDLSRTGPLLDTVDETEGSGQGLNMSRIVGRSPVGWAVLAFSIWGAPAMAATHKINAVGFLGWSWAILFTAVTAVGRPISDAG